MGPQRLIQLRFTVGIGCSVLGGLVWVVAILTWNPFLMAASGALGGMGGLVGVLALRRLHRLVDAYGANVCLACGYPMGGLPDRYACPECGQPHDRSEAESRLRPFDRFKRNTRG